MTSSSSSLFGSQADGNFRLLKSFVCSNVISAKRGDMMVTHPGELRQRRVHLLVAGRDGLTDVCVVPEGGEGGGDTRHDSDFNES